MERPTNTSHEAESRISGDANVDILVGLVALQAGLITPDRLLAAVKRWLREKNGPLGEALVAQQALVPNELALVAALVEQLLYRHDGRVEESIASLSPARDVLADLMSLSDPAVDATLTLVVTPGSRGEESADSPSMCEKAESSAARYKVLRPHAHGGLGKVSVALDQELGREVALKELRDRYANDADYRARFLIEAEITGGLEHPGVVPVYGLGQYADGRPFYAMRFVRGDSLLEAIRRYHENRKTNHDEAQASLELRQLLGRFIDVCQAMHYAHHRGVLHRDLKPANIMLGQYGETLIVDWGLAKAQGRNDDQSSAGESVLRPKHASGSSATRLGSAVGTPAYMSPEQAGGRLDQLGPATDIYSLGATLYSLLTGQPPFKEEDVSKLIERVKAGDLRRPREIVPRIAPALEAICLKAMALQPDQRYRTAAALVADVERFLADEPVQAYSEPLLARSWRWVRKHRTFAAATAATLVVSTVGFAIATAIVDGWRRQAAELATREGLARRQAVDRLRDARSAVDVWLTGTSDLASLPTIDWPGGGAQHIRVQLLQQAAADYERFATQDTADFDLQLERGRTYLRLGDVRRLLGEDDAAGKSYLQAERLFTDLTARDGEQLDARVELASARVRLGLYEAGKKDLPAAERYYESAVEILEPIAASAPEHPRVHDALGTVFLNRAVLQRDREQNQVAQQSLDASLTHFYKAVAVGGGNQRLALAMASANMIRAELSRRAGQYDAAVGHARRAVDCVVAQASSRALDVQTTKVRAHAKLYLASVLRPLGRYEEERLAYDEALVDIEKLCATLPDVPDYLTYRAQTQLDYALLLHLMRDCPSAKKMLEAALPWLERVANASSNPQEVFELAIGRDALGEVLRDLGDAEAARQLHALAGQSLARLATDFPMVPEYRFRRALNRSYFGQSVAAARADAEAHEAWAGAERLLDDLIREASAAGATSAGDLARYHQARGFVRMYRGYLSWSRDNADGAQRAFGEALADLRSATKVGAAAVEYVHDLAWFQVKCPLDSLRAADDAVRAAEQASSTVPANVNFLGTLGAAQIRAKNFADGAATLRRVIEARPPGDPRDWLFLAVAQTKLNKRDEARQSWKTGLDRMQALCPASVELRAIEKEFAPLFGEGR